MEGWPSSPEAIPEEPDYAAKYGDRMATYLGVTAPISQLIEMCPVDLNNPDLKGKINEIVAEIGNESRWEVDSEDAAFFNKVADERGQERRVTVVKTTENKTTDHENVTAKEKEISTETHEKVTRHTEKTPEIRSINDKHLPESAQLLDRRVHEEHFRNVVGEKVVQPPIEDAEQPVVSNVNKLNETVKVVPREDKAHQAEHNPSEAPTTIEQSISVSETPEQSDLPDISIESVLADETSAEIAEPAIDLPEKYEQLLAMPVMTLQELLHPDVEVIENVTLTDEQSAEPVASVSEQIRTFAEEIFAETEPERELLLAGLVEEAEQISRMLVQQEALPTEEGTTIEPEMLEQFEARLEIVCQRILETLGMESVEPEQAKQLVRAFLKQELEQALLQPEAEVDLEHEGTHESKTSAWFDDFIDTLDGLTNFIGPVGRLALQATL